MDENTLYCLRRTPPEEFVRKLRASLTTQAIVVSAPRRFRRLAAIVACCAVLIGAFTLPPVRAAAQAFLDMFRVVHFVAVPINSAAVHRLSNGELDLPHLLGDQIQWSQQSAGPSSYSSPQAAGTAAGFHVQLPAWMPVGWDAEAPLVQERGERTAHIVANTAPLQQLLTSLDINDVQIPADLNGQSATLRIPPTVSLKWTHGAQTVELLQSPSPEVSFPTGTDLAALGEIGLRILGLSHQDAYRFAQSIDWRTTLVVPVPVNAVVFTQVNIQGNSGLLMDLVANTGQQAGQRRRGGAMVLWSAGGQVFALRGALPSAQLVEMAQTMQ